MKSIKLTDNGLILTVLALVLLGSLYFFEIKLEEKSKQPIAVNIGE